MFMYVSVCAFSNDINLNSYYIPNFQIANFLVGVWEGGTMGEKLFYEVRTIHDIVVLPNPFFLLEREKNQSLTATTNRS